MTSDTSVRGRETLICRRSTHGQARHPMLSERRNIVIIADEAHRSQYDFIDGFGRHMRDALPHASFVGFTGTPIEKTDANTRAVFGDYISVYDIQRAVADGATDSPSVASSSSASMRGRSAGSSQSEAVAVMLEKYEVCRGLFHGFDWGRRASGTPQDRLSLLPLAQDHILALEDGKARLLRAVTELTKAFALSVPHEEALRIRDDVGF
jgi:type I site-specific restriction-modification system R (restriction) subunit